jgi:hypothetical protein
MGCFEIPVGTALDPLERWLAMYLPPANEPHDAGALTSVNGLAARYYGAELPTPTQIRAVYRALRALEEQGLAQRWTTPFSLEGCPAFWTQSGP